MKPSDWIFASFMGLAVALPMSAAPKASTADSRVQVEFISPEKFTDLKADASGTRKGRESYLEQLKGYLILQAASQLPRGQRLSVSITHVDMAGDFEPWRRQSLTNVRVLRDQYPPRIDLSFKITDAKGKVIRQGSRGLKNLSFMRDAAINRQDPLRHEKKLLDDWIRRDLAGKN
ncbi:MAG: DUF3016 domain-containing protein [Verrucomicrobiaceae bacterium]|nr:MAG: DUF3016 domain-containing protein [Verrucomicrobiaceae bacterium]